jgi:hypothetical protein
VEIKRGFDGPSPGIFMSNRITEYRQGSVAIDPHHLAAVALDDRIDLSAQLAEKLAILLRLILGGDPGGIGEIAEQQDQLVPLVDLVHRHQRLSRSRRSEAGSTPTIRA